MCIDQNIQLRLYLCEAIEHLREGLLGFVSERLRRANISHEQINRMRQQRHQFRLDVENGQIRWDSRALLWAIDTYWREAFGGRWQRENLGFAIVTKKAIDRFCHEKPLTRDGTIGILDNMRQLLRQVRPSFDTAQQVERIEKILEKIRDDNQPHPLPTEPSHGGVPAPQDDSILFSIAPTAPPHGGVPAHQGENVGQMVCRLLKENPLSTNPEIAQAVQENIPTARTTAGSVACYRTALVAAGIIQSADLRNSVVGIEICNQLLENPTRRNEEIAEEVRQKLDSQTSAANIANYRNYLGSAGLID